MLVTTTNFKNETVSMELPVTEEQLKAWKAGELIQNAMPNLTPTQREFLISGMTEEEQKEFFNTGEENDDNYFDSHEDFLNSLC